MQIVDNQPYEVPGQLLRAYLEMLDPLRGHDLNLLRAKAQGLKQTDGEGWAVGEMLERACVVLGAYVDPRKPR